LPQPPQPTRRNNSLKQQASREGGVRTLLGRWRPIDELRSADGSKRQRALRQVVNSQIQGSAADLIKLAMVRGRLGLLLWFTSALRLRVAWLELVCAV